MIYCPKCGTANREGSRFCNECGEKLGTQTRLKCPECGALNSVQNLFCDQCGARLMPAPPPGPGTEATPTIKGLSLPTKTPLGQEGQEDQESTAAQKRGSEEDLPAWLQELSASLAADSPARGGGSSAGEEEMPDWLQGLRSSLPPEQEKASDESAAMQGEPEPEPEAAAEPEPLAEAEEVPDWLAELRPAEAQPAPEAAAEPEPVTEAEEVPDWLAELRPAQPEPPPEEGLEAILPETESEAEKGPEWLAALAADAALAAVEAAAREPEEKAGEEPAPDWLTDLEPPAGAEMPDWLAELEVAAATEGVTPPSETTPEWLPDLPDTPEQEADLVGEELAAAELPDWLVPSEEGTAGGERLEKAEIPDWLLALKPKEAGEAVEEGEAPELTPSGPVEETGLLAGLAGTLPVEMLIAQPRAASEKEFEPPPSVETPQSRLFAEIVAQPLPLTPKALLRRRAPRLGKLPLLLINLILLAVVALPIVLGTSFLPRTIEPTPAVTALYNAIKGLESRAPVLVVFDYDPTTSGEMDVIARALVSHLAERQAQIVALSLLPAGPATAQNLLDDVVGPGSYVNLGYLPGQPVAVRLLGESLPLAVAADFRGTPLTDLGTMAELHSLQDFALVIELAASQDSLRWWVEQAQAPYDVPLAAGVSASVEPLARAYYETQPPQLVGLVGGVPGAARYDAARGGAQGPGEALLARLDAQLAGHIVLILVLLIGNGVYLVRRRTEEER